MENKICKKCNQLKAIKAFNVDRSRHDNYHPYCTECKTAPYKADPDLVKQRRDAIKNRKEKKCCLCKIMLPLEKFGSAPSHPDGTTYSCKKCVAKKARIERAALSEEDRKALNVKSYQQRADAEASRRYNRKMEIVKCLGGKCTCCGLTPSKEWPINCFDFHHLDPTQKEITPAKVLRKPFEKAMKELEKCAVVCANCHRKIHFDHTARGEGINYE